MLDWYVGGRRILGTPRRRPGARGTRRGLPRARSALALALSVTSAVLLVTASPTRAGTFTADMCEGPADTFIGTAGLQELLLGEAQFVSGEDHCGTAGEQVTMQLGPDASGYANLQGGLYVYASPSGVAITSYTLRVSAYAAPCGLASGHCPGGVGQVFIDHTGELDPHYDFRDLGEGSEGPVTVSQSGLLGVTDVLVGATCDGGCPSAQTIAGVSIPEGRFTLVDSTVPKITARFDPPEGVPLSGQAEWSFTAADAGGPGLYRALDSVDGKTIGARALSEGGGLCENLGTEAEPVFASPQPCPVESNGSVTVDTNDLADGEHTVHVYVETAAGNSADVFDGRIITANGPIVEEAPTITGVPQVGATLSATNATFSLRPEQESAGPVSGQWESCVNASSCQPIKGATGPTYVLGAADLGRELVYESAATARVIDATARGLLHTTTSPSVPTPTITEAGGTCGGSCSGPGNGGPGGNGGSGGGSGGTGTSGAGAGSGISLSLAGLGPGAGPLVQLGSSAPWRVSLAISPQRVHRRTTIRISGRVQTAPRPQTGKLIYLQARDVRARLGRVAGRLRLVPSYSRWITFMALRANLNGGFSTAYRFRLGGRHSYQFRAVAPAEGQFRNQTGSSRIVAVHET
jgi:hypothetical protein